MSNNIIELQNCECEKYRDFLYKYYKKNLVQDDYLLKILSQIEKYIKGSITIKGHTICDSKGVCRNFYSIPIKDRLGKRRNAKIIKKIISQDNIYEIRINEEDIKHRIFIFAINEEKKEFICENHIFFNFAIGKKQNYCDYTNELSKESQNIFNRILMGEIDRFV